jgi:Nidogen-like
MKQAARSLLTTVLAAGYCVAQGLNPLSITIPSPNVQNLTWIAGDQRPYWLETSLNLEAWSDLSTTPTIGTGGSVTVTDNSITPKKFYRLRVGAVRLGFDDFELDRQDDDPSEYTPIGFPVFLFGKTENSCWVNNNGNITFHAAEGTYTPFPLQQYGHNLIAPFWADVDTRPEGSQPVTYSYGTEMIDGRLAFGVNWVNVGYYNFRDDKLNSFQLVLIQRSDIAAGDFDIEFNYNQVLWETGEHPNSGGVDGYGGFPARAGLSNGSNRTIELEYSGQTLAQLDKNPTSGIPNLTTGLIYRSRNSTVPGRFVFQVRSGSVLGALQVSAGPDQSLASGVLTTSLAGSASDPSGGAVTVQWTVLKGPSGVIFSNANIVNPTVTLPSEETIVLQLKATSVADPSITASDSMVINP